MINNLVSRRSESPVAPATGSGRVIPARVRPQTSQTYYHRNQQYSIVGLTNAAGTLVERYTYSAYGTLGIYAANGTVRSSSTYANRYTYTGREWDGDLRLYHFRARWYDPATGGFVSRDPLGYVDGMSLYRGYFGVSSVDPNGTRSVCCTFRSKGWSGSKTTFSYTLDAGKGVSAAARCKAYADWYSYELLGASEGNCQKRPKPAGPKPWRPNPKPTTSWEDGVNDCYDLVPTPPGGPTSDWDDDDDMPSCYEGCIKVHQPQPGWVGHCKMHDCCQCCYKRHLALCYSDTKKRTACQLAALHFLDVCLATHGA